MAAVFIVQARNECEVEFDTFLNMPAFAGLNPQDKAKIIGLMKTPAKREFFFLMQLVGNPPERVGLILSDEFVRRFSECPDADELPPILPGVATWEQLQDAVLLAAESSSDERLRAFWKNMVHILDVLPKSDEQSADGAVRHASRRISQVWSFATCNHCWRRVAYSSGKHRKTAGYCFVHDLPSSHPVFRKHSRLARDLAGEQQAAVGRIMALVRAARSEKKAQEAIIASLTTPNDCLPRLARYLDEIGHDGTPEGLLWAFHGPIEAITDAAYVAGLDEYIRYVLDNHSRHLSSLFSYDELSRAEAWLILLGK